MIPKPTDNDIYQTLFRAIHEHYLLPDTHLPEDELAKSFNVSRTRIRKVLERLTYEQLVIKQPNKGCFVASMSQDQVHEVFAARRLLETGIIDLLTLPLFHSKQQQLRQLCDEEAVALANNDYGRANTLSGDFHNKLAAMTGNDTLTAMVKQLIARTSLAIAIYSNPKTMQCDNGCHYQLLKLLAQNDRQAIKTLMTHHLNELEEHLLIEDTNTSQPDFQSIIKHLKPSD